MSMSGPEKPVGMSLNATQPSAFLENISFFPPNLRKKRAIRPI
jgi:hypothetical protein